MVRNKLKKHKAITSSIPKPPPPPLEQGWGTGAVITPQQFLSATPSSSCFSMGSAGEHGSPPPALPGLFVTFFLTILAVGSAVPCSGSAGSCWVQQRAALAVGAWAPAGPQTGFITRIVCKSSGEHGSTVSCNLSSGR